MNTGNTAKNHNMSHSSNNNNNNNTKRLHKMASILSIGSHSHRGESAASKSIRSVRDDAIETMVVGVNWAASGDDDRGQSSSSYYHGEEEEDDMKKQEKAEDTNSSSTTIPTGTHSDHSGDHHPLDDLEQAAAATVATLVRASRRRANSGSAPAAPSPPQHAAPRLLVRDEPLPRASKSTPCRSWRLLLMNGIGISLIVGGLAFAAYQYIEAPRYVSVDTGRPVGAVVCSGGRSRLGGNNNNINSGALFSNNTVEWMEEQREQVEDLCGDLEEWKQPCTFAIFYSFTVEDGDATENDSSNVTTTVIASASSSSNQVYVGVDTWQFGNPTDHQCHDQSLLEQKYAEYMAFAHMTIHYQEGSNPADTNQYYAPTLQPHTMAAIIAAISCGLGLLFLCSSLLECVC